MEYYSAVVEKDSFVITWLSLEDIIVSGIRQVKKEKIHIYT